MARKKRKLKTAADFEALDAWLTQQAKLDKLKAENNALAFSKLKQNTRIRELDRFQERLARDRD